MQIEFITDLVTHLAPEGVKTPWLKSRATKWQLSQDFIIKIDGQEYCVPEGYIFDGASIPWWMWWLFPPRYRPAWRAAAFHDCCYSHWYRQITKEFADRAFHAIMLADGASPAIADKFYWAVKTFGRGGW